MSDPVQFSSGDDASFRKDPPKPDTDVHFVPPHFQEERLSNGLRVLLAERHDMPIVAVQIVVDRGTDLQRAPGVATMAATMMLTGTQSRSALELSDALEGLGARYSSRADHDGMGVSGQSLRHCFPGLFSILADVVRHPSFLSAELERERARRLSTLWADNDVPDVLLERIVDEELYPQGHPYHASLMGDAASIKGLSVDDLCDVHQAALRPAHATVTLAGDIDKASAMQLLEEHLGDWSGEPIPRKVFPEPILRGKNEKRIVLVNRQGASQSTVVVARIGIARQNPDYDAIMVLNTLLGGQFSSRLNMNLREKHAYSYGAYSLFEPRQLPGAFTAGAAVTTAHTAPAIREIFFEMERLRHELVSDMELQNAKTNIIRKLPARFETAAGTAQALASLAVLGLPLDVFATRQARAAKVTAEEIRCVAEKYLDPDSMGIFVVGDASVIQKDLENLGRGEIDVREMTIAEPSSA